MLQRMLLGVFGSRNQRFLKSIGPMIQAIGQAEAQFKQYSDEDLFSMTATFKARLSAGETLDDLLPEAFAVVREASVRTLGLRHFDEQLMGGVVLHRGKIAEMGTGEGKTLGATLAAYLNALTGNGVHVVTVNGYLAARDEAWMRPIYTALGISTGVVAENMDFTARQRAYAADITYGTNNEFGFDYLRDHMAHTLEHQVQRGHAFVIVDEVDSILIDDARTPLIISGEVQEDLDRYEHINQLALQLELLVDFTIDEKERLVLLTEAGHQKVEKLLAEQGLLSAGGLYDIQNIRLLHTLNAVLRGQHCFKKDIDYIIQEDQIVLIDEHTGRAMAGRRWSDGLHQAVEAKEGVMVQKENRTLASITLQNYFRMYQKLSGMTGTADTEAYEFQQIYGLEVVILPTHKPLIRKDLSDRMFVGRTGKYRAIVKEVQARHQTKQPVLVGTASIENSEYLSKLLTEVKVPHSVLNAKKHGQEAEIIAQAGCLNAVTIATNMAGRGTDIVLGGAQTEAILADQAQLAQWKTQHAAVLALGGLHVLGTERHESRRIDNQLRGRAGRQGDPGSSQFYIALDDHLMRIFAGPKVIDFMRKMMTEDETLERPILTRQIEGAQRKVEGFNFDIRKQLLRFDDVASEQRQLIYHQRQVLLESGDISENIQNMLTLVIQKVVETYIPADSFAEQWDVDELMAVLRSEFSAFCPIDSWQADVSDLTAVDIQSRVLKAVQSQYQQQEIKLTLETIRTLEKGLMLEVVDQHWYDHLTAMEQLREGIHLRGYAQKNPTEEYKRESFELFKQMLFSVKRETLSLLLRAELSSADASVEGLSVEPMGQAQHPSVQPILAGTQSENVIASPEAVFNVSQSVSDQTIHSPDKIGRNQPCPCGSGKKYKRCHGALSSS